MDEKLTQKSDMFFKMDCEVHPLGLTLPADEAAKQSAASSGTPQPQQYLIHFSFPNNKELIKGDVSKTPLDKELLNDNGIGKASSLYSDYSTSTLIFNNTM